MEPKIIAYIVYLLLMLLSGFVTSAAGLVPNKWQYWVLVFSLVGCYLCGYVRGG